MIEIVAANLRDVSYIASHMRETDAREIWATEHVEDPILLAHKLVAVSGLAWCARRLEGGSYRPIAAWGAHEMHPCAWQVWAFATPEFVTIGKIVTRHIKMNVIPEIFHRGATYVYAMSIEGHDLAHRWLRYLGASVEHEDGPDRGAVHDYGKDGETFYRFRWTRDSVRDFVS